MRALRAIFSLSLIVSGSGAMAAPPQTPPLPYNDEGACNFECCTFRDWTTNAPVDARSKPSAAAPIAFHLDKGITVKGVTGVVITDKYGVTRMRKSADVGFNEITKKPELMLRPGEKIYTLHYGGEGVQLFWYKGKTYESLLDESATQSLSRPHYVWWVKIQTADGKSGWTTQAKNFDNMDACG